MIIIGFSAYYHDSAASLLVNGKIISAVQEERFSRVRHDSSFPEKSLTYCLKQLPNGIEDVDWIVFYEKPLKKFHRLLQTYMQNNPKGYEFFEISIKKWLSDSIFQKNIIIDEF